MRIAEPVRRVQHLTTIGSRSALSRPRARSRRLSLPRWLPREHGFWVMLGAALASALLRTKGERASLLVAALMASAAICGAMLSHRWIRKHGAAQLIAAAMLALSSVPVELAAKLPTASVAVATLARGVVFVSSALIVRAAFAHSVRDGARRSLALRLSAVSIAIFAAVLLLNAGWAAEAGACLSAALTCGIFVWKAPTAKQLKPVGLSLAALAVISALILAL